ncbi:uncharacterized protein LOC143367314 isoform X2 [Andrena cerasifolii]|uniref:uncharacterized protein LOC143367314 isoform X2 n=1 Tax=Andrena cerasifolii TaxID=2819439 RepID=UPI004037F598
MAVSTMWIRNNMLFSPTDQLDRQLTEAELKVQRSILKLSIPDWYMNKRSNPPKILNNVTPIESRPSSWKSFENKKHSTLSDTLPHAEPATITPEENSINGVSKISKQKSPEAKHEKSPSKSSSPKVEVFDTTLPKVKLSTNISRTFPKMSPSRKIQNINLVFPPAPPIKHSSAVVEDIKCEVVASEDQSINDNTKTDNDMAKDHTPPKTSTQTTKDSDFQFSNIMDTPSRTPYIKGDFKVPAASTPRFTPANLTILEEAPKLKKVPSRNILEKFSIFEEKSTSFPQTSPEVAPRPRRLSKSLLEKASFFEDSSKLKHVSLRSETSSISSNCVSSYLERNMRSIDPIFFEKDNALLGIPKSSTLIREIVTKLEVSGNGVSTPEKKSTLEWKRSIASVQERKSELEAKRAAPIVQAKKPKLPLEPNTQSPCSRFMNSRRKSVDLEHVVRSKLAGRVNTVVQGIIEALTEKVSKPSVPRQIEVAGVNQSFVKQLVNALENGEETPVIGMSSRKDSTTEEDSCSESCATTTSLKDTDSNSDSEQRSAILRSDDESLASDSTDTATTKGSQSDRKPEPEEDSVYWIPVSRCKLPRSSSLLSIMSRLSGNGQSPCVSPIRSDSEAESSQMPERGGTFKKTNNALSRKLFRIDETTVIDSGYSDRSDKSTCGFVTNSTWSEDSQNDSTLENRATRVKRSSRPRPSIGHTFRISC